MGLSVKEYLFQESLKLRDLFKMLVESKGEGLGWGRVMFIILKMFMGEYSLFSSYAEVVGGLNS